MKSLTRLILAGIAISTLAVPPAHAARRVEVQDRIDIPLVDVDRKPLSLADTRAAILTAARQRGWQVKTDEPGMIRLDYTYRRGNAGASIEVPYQAGSYSIIYAGSYGMGERGSGARRTIKSGYLQWTRNLAHDIDVAAMRGADQQPGPQLPQEAADDPDDKDADK